MSGLLIEGVAPGSIADEFELQAGDRLLAVNGCRLRDIIDYSYYTSSEEELLLEIARKDGEIWELEIERERGEALGLTFAPLYISVHATNPELRRRLLGKDGIPPILEQLKVLAAARITLHTQVVLC